MAHLQGLLGHLPLRQDFDEAAPVYSALITLMIDPESNIVAFPALLDPAVRAFGSALVQFKVPMHVKRHVAVALGALHNLAPAEVQQIAHALPQEQQEALQTLSSPEHH
jgi:hypothetical protein